MITATICQKPSYQMHTVNICEFHKLLAGSLRHCASTSGESAGQQGTPLATRGHASIGHDND